MRRLRSAALLCVSLSLSVPVAGSTAADAPSRARFERLMRELAAAWNAGDARRAAACFTADAIYSEPPARQLYRGREELFEFFGGDGGRVEPMHIVWHHLAYDEASSIGMGEFSFWIGDGDPAHGVVVVRVEADGIANWREYYYESELHWEEFTASNSF